MKDYDAWGGRRKQVFTQKRRLVKQQEGREIEKTRKILCTENIHKGHIYRCREKDHMRR